MSMVSVIGIPITETSRSLSTCYKEHIRYIRSNNPQSAFALQLMPIVINTDA